MGLVKVMVPLTGILDVLTGLQFNRLVETCSTMFVPDGPES